MAVTQNFVDEVTKYFMTFLQTDFHKRRYPKRSSTLKSRNGLKVGFDLEIYPDLKEKIISCIKNNFSESSLTLSRNQYVNNMPPLMLSLLDEKINSLEDSLLQTVFDSIYDSLNEYKSQYANDYDYFIEQAKEMASKSISGKFIQPLLNDLDSPLERLQLADANSKYQIEMDITDSLFSLIEDSYSIFLQIYFNSANTEETRSILNDLINIDEIKSLLSNYFNNLSTRDAFDDINKINSNNKLIDKTEVYMYFCDIKLGREKFPFFYMPITLDSSNASVTISFDKRMFVNKDAIDFAVQEYNHETENQGSLSHLDRIIYLDTDTELVREMRQVLSNVEQHFEINDGVNFLQHDRQNTSSNLLVSLTNSFCMYIFDKSDESLINDYEEVLNDEGTISDCFLDLIKGFISTEPKSFIDDVEREWSEQDYVKKLVVESPIPLNDEQKQVMIALNKPDCKVLLLEGPPGTGKSHTITAIICRALLENKTVLVLSDKKEALDVVQDKITDTLNSIRDEDVPIQNPILRLGKSGKNLSKIVSNRTISSIREYRNSSLKEAEKRAANLEQEKLNIQSNHSSIVEFYSRFDLEEIRFYFENLHCNDLLSDEEQSALDNLKNNKSHFDTIEKMHVLRKFFKLLVDASGFFDDTFCVNDIQQFLIIDAAPSVAVKKLEEYLESLKELKRPLLGYWLRSNKIDEANRNLKKYYPYFKNFKPGDSLELFEKVLSLFSLVIGRLDDVIKFEEAIKGLNPSDFDRWKKLNISNEIALGSESIALLLKWRAIENKLEKYFDSEPEDDFQSSMANIEGMKTIDMALVLDNSIVNYSDYFANELNTVKQILRNKKKFPQKIFENMKSAFPCILSGIRDYAEFIPLKKDLFDLIIIDEASQVSIAQSLPALIRGKQVLVMGDDKQFSNVKSNHASKRTNQEWKSRIQEVFRQDFETTDETEYLVSKVRDNFDIKNSILKFCRFIRNYECLLKKHFRGYPELISYSNKNFYGNSLQCMKIRGKPISEVIKFDILPHDGLFDSTKNTNKIEAKFIIDSLVKFKESQTELSVGIISPHREQVQLISEMIDGLPDRDWFRDKLNLKVMTFDTCQGEERDHIFYSMVATNEQDKLNYIFIKDLNSIDDEENGSIRAQRLNVGFSRAKECMHFVLSKEIEAFSGEIKNALLHYKNELENSNDQFANTDPRSPMETKVLHYVQQTDLFNENKIEIIPQFKIGEYLRQLDRRYRHPSYKVDFLLVFDEAEFGNLKVVVEYDGFKEHFTNRENVGEHNYSYYMREEDVYRQKVLEGYGYKFLRINRFNLGKDEASRVSKLNDRLAKLVKKKALTV